jgi:hypothetical protein
MATKKRNSHFGTKEAKVTFKWNGTDSSGVANSTTASHGTGVYIPSGAIVTNAFYNIPVGSTFTDGATDTATLALTLQSAGDLKAAISIATAGDVWDEGLHGCLPGSYSLDGNSATAIVSAAAKAASYLLLTAEREIVVTVGTAALTAGEMDIMIEYWVP